MVTTTKLLRLVPATYLSLSGEGPAAEASPQSSHRS